MRIVFWGTPEFALPSFRALIGEGHDIVGVVTRPDRRAGRRRELRAPPVKAAALDEHIPVAQPERPRGDAFLRWLIERAPDLNVVVAYGRILKPEVLDAPRLGSLNVHASLLPELRGGAPIQWAIARCHDVTGVSITRMTERLDAGPVLLQIREPIGPDETGAELAARLAEIGAAALVEALALLDVGALEEIPQDEAGVTLAPLVSREHSRIDWLLGAREIGCHVRGFDDVPGAWARTHREEIKMFRPVPEPEFAHDLPPGSLLRVDPANAARSMLIACGTGAIWIREVQPAGRRRMTSADWLRGRSLQPGDRFT